MAQEYVDSKKSLDTGGDVVMADVTRDGELSEADGRKDKDSGSLNGADRESVAEQDMDEDQASDDPEDEDGLYERRQIPVTVARVLFLACDACFYCGGKFVG
jgi:hypothetical protein